MSHRLPIVVAFLLALTVSAPAKIMWGANGHPFNAYPGISFARQLDYLADLGLKSYRVNISSVDEAPELAKLVKEAKARGIEILPVITPGNIDLDKESPAELYQKAFKLAVALGSRFKNDIRTWELGNEMENYAIIRACEKRDDGTQFPCIWKDASGMDPLDYYGPRWAKASAVLKGLSDGMISVDPTIKKAMGTAGWGHIGAFERMKHDGIKWDISVWHAYGQDPEWAFRFLAQYGHPIWLTEFNHPFGSQHGEEAQAKGLVKTMKRLEELSDRYKLQAAHIYELMDETYWRPDYEAYMGLVHMVKAPDGKWEAGTPKPAYFAVRSFIRGPDADAMPARDCKLADVDDGDPLDVRQIRYSYCLVLGRPADGGGLESWLTALQKGNTNLTDILLDMLRSDEFEQRYKTFALTDAGYVTLLYRLFLDRTADAQGLEAYSKQIAAGTMTRAGIALAIIKSDEFRTHHPILFASQGALRAPVASPPG